MGIKVSQMPSTNTLTDNDLIMVVQDNENKKINKKDLQNNLTDPSLTKRVEELEKENAYLNNLVEQAFDKKEVEGEELSINDTIEAKMNVSLYGNTKQNGEPTPVTPVEIQRVTGNNKVVVSNKNLLSNNATSQTINGVVFIKNEDGSITAKGTATAITDIYILGNTTTYKKINGYGNLKLNGCNDGSLSTYMLYCVQNKNGTLSYYQNYKDDINITSTEEDTFRVFIRVMANATINTTFYPMIRFSNTATSYVPHKETIYELDLGNIELCKIGNYQDYFYKNNNKWYKREVIGSVTLDGSEKWHLAERTDTNNGVIYIDYSTIGRSDFSNKGAYSNYAKFITSFSTKVGQFDTHYSQWRFYAPTNTITVNEWKTMLKTTNLQLKYIKSESSDIEITDTTLISQLEALKTAMSYTEQTNISQINDDIPFILKVTALANYNSRIVALENAILNANRTTQTENTRKSNEVIEETKKEVVDK